MPSQRPGWVDGRLEAASEAFDGFIEQRAGETFHRTAITHRLEWDLIDDRVTERHGFDAGGAVRGSDPNQLVYRSGSVDALGEVDLGGASPQPNRAIHEDLHRTAERPDREALESWLRDAATRDLVELRRVWVEVGVTLDAFANQNAAQKRVRCRVWAGWQPRQVGRMSSRPLLIGARNWPRLRDADPQTAWREREVHRGRAVPWPDHAALALSPDVASALVQRLVWALHRPNAEPGLPVGAGWRVNHLPTDRTSLFGADRDDQGQPTQPLALADGATLLAGLPQKGNLWRGSFRDLPEWRPLCIDIDAPEVEIPHGAGWVTDLSVHPIAADQWLLQLEGRPYPEGVAYEPLWLRASPAEIVRSCLGGFGRRWESVHGVRTTGLLFSPGFG